MNKRPSRATVELLNLKLKEEGSSIRYFESFKDGDTTVYRVGYFDKFIDKDITTSIATTKDFELFVRNFFKSIDAEDTGYSNTVSTITTLG